MRSEEPKLLEKVEYIIIYMTNNTFASLNFFHKGLKMFTNYIMFIKNSAPHIVLLQILSICLANIILIGLIIYEQKNQDKLSNDEKKIILYSEFTLSFIGSSILLLFMSYILRTPFSLSFFPYFIYSLVLILTTPFALIIIRMFLSNKTYIKNINILLIISILFSMFFTFNAGR
jgi:hypothetical protein